MSVGSWEFFAFAALVIVLYHLYNGPRYHLWVLALANVLFLATWLETPQETWLAVGTIVAGYAVGRLLQDGRLRGRVVVAVYAAALLGIFVYTHRYGLALVGYSYLMFKQIHALIDAEAGRLPTLRPLAWFDYTCGFYVWLSGPIQRYGDFVAQADRDGRPPDTGQVLAALDRVVNGCFKVLLVAPWIAAHTGPAVVLEAPAAPYFWGRVAAFAFGYYAFLYLDFGGYCDIVIGLAALLGLQLPENFRRPWLARNMLDFWQRWHVTLSLWLRDYVFNALYLALLRGIPRGGAVWAVLAYLVTFDVAGLWHGLTWNFIGFGLMHGVGTAANQVGRMALKRWLSPAALARYQGHHALRVPATVLCQSYVALSMLIFAYPPHTLLAVWNVARLQVGG